MTTRFTIHSFETLDSTQILARAWCEDARAKTGDVISAREQTAGYGRRGRNWETQYGNMAVTWVEDFTADILPWISFAVSLGLYDAAKKILPSDATLTLKWPNDVLLNDGKLSGILIEIVDDKMLIGMGVNLAHAPELDQKTAAFADVMTPPTADAFLPQFLTAYDHWFQIGKIKGFAGLRDTWLARAKGLNTTVSARLADGRVLTGVFTDLDPSGALLLNTPEGPQHVTAADIFIARTNDQKKTNSR